MGLDHPLNCYIVSLKYSPGLAKEFELLGRNFRQRGWTTRYLLSASYSWLMDDKSEEIHEITRSRTLREVIVDTARAPLRILPELRSLFLQFPPHRLLIYNSHPLNVVVMRLAQQICPEGMRTVYLHEPFVADRLSYGRARALYICLGEILQALTLRYTTAAVVPSDYSKALFDMHFAAYGRAVHTAPLLLPDKPPLNRTRRFVSLIGHLNSARGLQDFINLVNFAADQGEKWAFKIMTRSKIGDTLKQLSFRAQQMVEVVNRPKISDEEIAGVVTESIAIFLPHKQAAQSGNVPVAFRAGTPIIARDIPGLSQHIHHKVNGYLFPFESSPAQLFEGVRYVQGNFGALSHQARQDFDLIFSEKNWDRYYRWFLELDTGRKE